MRERIPKTPVRERITRHASWFGHPPSVLNFWRSLTRPLLRQHSTPFYLFSITPIEEALGELDSHFGHLPVRHWLSCKTQPLRPLLQWWRRQGRGIEVVSEFEFLAALQEGFPPPPADRVSPHGCWCNRFSRRRDSLHQKALSLQSRMPLLAAPELMKMGRMTVGRRLYL